jgi:hypothetical protein
MEDPGPKDVAVDLRRVEVQRLRSAVDRGLEPVDFTSSGPRHDYRRVPAKRGLLGAILK